MILAGERVTKGGSGVPEKTKTKVPNPRETPAITLSDMTMDTSGLSFTVPSTASKLIVFELARPEYLKEWALARFPGSAENIA